MKGYFAIGAEGISKPMNLGALMRTANAFGASFVFSVNAEDKTKIAYKADTSRTFKTVPYYQWDSIDEMVFPKGLQMVGIELTDDAVELPEFRHPRMAAYVLGPERGSLSEAMVAKCDHVVKIPTKFCINVSLAGALVMYDRIRSMGGWRDRPVMPGGPKAL
ncbi:RNA methyltransferase [Hyphomonas sp. FCG-A18]|jgi:tRNA G18 (ribose-2'-O)-methylase SpoU|uniref:RNA methyltransferase n=1 Tax=Hyphomonas sp. FCG-A18 TaxID=3080019 RepID=UPI002B2A4789|nr:RNA methyltransferase [Hyphomonas sp. FCG-A18]